MLNRYKFFLLIISSLLLASCGKPLPQLDNFDQKAWKNDKNACLGHRLVLAGSLEAQKEKMLALDEMSIVSLLGKPDQNELYKRNQKFYIYYLQPGPVCQPAAAVPTKKLVIRFNAMGLAKEITVE